MRRGNDMTRHEGEWRISSVTQPEGRKIASAPSGFPQTRGVNTWSGVMMDCIVPRAEKILKSRHLSDACLSANN